MSLVLAEIDPEYERNMDRVNAKRIKKVHDGRKRLRKMYSMKAALALRLFWNRVEAEYAGSRKAGYVKKGYARGPVIRGHSIGWSSIADMVRTAPFSIPPKDYVFVEWQGWIYRVKKPV